MKQVLEKILEEMKYLEEKEYVSEKYHEYFIDGACCAMSDIRGIIQRHMADVPDTNIGKWIPVSERLPEKEYDTVLCVTDDDYYFVAVYTSEHMFRTGDIGADVSRIVAWRPLPEPYQEG